MLVPHKLQSGVFATAVVVGVMGVAAADPPPVAPQPAPAPAVRAGAASAPVPKEPAWKGEFRERYGLKDGAVVRRVAPPYPACRAEYFNDQLRAAYARLKKQPPPADDPVWDHTEYFTTFGWKGDWTVEALTAQNYPHKPEVGGTLGMVLRSTTGFGRGRTEADAELLDLRVTGDFVVRAGAGPEKVAAALEKILRKECAVPVSLAVREVERDVFVLSGKYEARPLAGRKAHRIEVYAVELRTGGGGGSGTLPEMAAHVEAFVETPVVLGEVTGAPKEVEWHFNQRSPATVRQQAEDRDPEAVVKNIATQTGLTAKREKRTIKVLVVKKVQ